MDVFVCVFFARRLDLSGLFVYFTRILEFRNVPIADHRLFLEWSPQINFVILGNVETWVDFTIKSATLTQQQEEQMEIDGKGYPLNKCQRHLESNLRKLEAPKNGWAELADIDICSLLIISFSIGRQSTSKIYFRHSVIVIYT
jgi:hypothetical protein